jgi:phage tail-like protein
MRRNEIEQLLPGVYQLALHPLETSALVSDTRLAGLLDAMEELHDPAEQILMRLDAYVDPRRAPDTFVTYLAGWVDLDWIAVSGRVTTGAGRLRELVAVAMEESRWRGSAKGLISFLVAATGVSGWTIDEAPPAEDGHRRPFHLLIHAPASVAPHAAMVERIVESEKPAAVTYEVTYDAGGVQ